MPPGVATGIALPASLPSVRTSTVVLVLANLVPLIGAATLGWSAREIFALYWTENAVVGGFTVLRFWTARHANLGRHAAAIPASLFFALHYGLFLTVHAAFVAILLDGSTGIRHDTLLAAPMHLLRLVLDGDGLAGLLALIASHAVSFVVDFVGGERDGATLGRLMFAPYLRVVAIHLALLVGGLLAFGSPGGDAGGVMLALLVGAKIALDLASRHAEHRLLRAPPPAHPAA